MTDHSNPMKYLVANAQDNQWGMMIHTVGMQRITHDYGTYPKPLVNHPSKYMFSPQKGRILDEYQLIYIPEGEGSFISAHCKETMIRGGKIIIIFPDEWHSYHPYRNTGWTECWIGFTGSSMDELVKRKFFCREHPVIDVGWNEEIIGLFNTAKKIAEEQKKGYQQLLAGIVHLLLGYTFTDNPQKADQQKQTLEKISEVKRYIVNHFCSEINMEDLAKQIGMSYSRLRFVFKKQTGLSLINYIEGLKILKCKDLLVNTNLTSQEIAYYTGFNTPYYFCMFFKKQVGCTPLQYRLQYQNKS